jgi:alpha-beta hydrolase superfamily lysophospholipase
MQSAALYARATRNESGLTLRGASSRHDEGRFVGERGIEIYYQAWTPPGNPRAVLVLVHGIGEHSGRYAHVADYLTRNSYALWASDLRGHGKSGGKRGHVDRFDDYLADISRLIRIAQEPAPASKTLLIGHSLGPLIALDYAEKHPSELAGLILSAPAFREIVKVPVWKVLIARTLSPVVPTFTTRTGLDPNLLSHDKEVVRKYVEDPLVHGVATARWFTEYRQAQERVMRAADKLTLPCLIMQGGADGIVDPSMTTNFFKKVASHDKTLKVYEGFYHEILNEPGKESVLADMGGWLSART